MRKLFFILLLFSACQKESITFKPAPVPTLQVRNITAHSALLIATLQSDSCVRGFLISKYNVPDLTRPDNDILWSPYGVGDYAYLANLEYRQVYYVRAFAYWRGQADNIGYSEVSVIKTE